MFQDPHQYKIYKNQLCFYISNEQSKKNKKTITFIIT